MKAKAYAKLNLFLDVIRKRDDGFHELKMFMQCIDLHDTIEINKADQLFFSCSDPLLPTDENNLVLKAFRLFQRSSGIRGADIKLTKRIPHGAGLGGGSSDAATTLLLLNELYQVGLTKCELQNMGATIGSDIPFFLEQSAALASGRGTDLEDEEAVSWEHILLIRPTGFLSTAEVYGALKLEDMGVKVNADAFLKSYRKGDWQKTSKHFYNALEKPAMRLDPRISEMKDKLTELGAFVSMMTGSGNVVFGLFNDKIVLNKAKEELENHVAWLCQTSLR